MDRRAPLTWLSTEQAGAEIGMTGEFVRRAIVQGKLRATAFAGKRRTYRIRSDHWAEFLAENTSQTDDPNWE
jgi:excisionase family DNA binding protein